MSKAKARQDRRHALTAMGKAPGCWVALMTVEVGYERSQRIASLATAKRLGWRLGHFGHTACLKSSHPVGQFSFGAVWLPISKPARGKVLLYT